MATGREPKRSSAPKRSSVRVLATIYWNPAKRSPGAAVTMTVRDTRADAREPAKA
jgi:hypothetical protein